MRDPGLLAVLGFGALAAALLIGSPFLYDAGFPGAHFWAYVALSVGGSSLILGALGACYLVWDWIRGRGKSREKVAGERRDQEQIARINMEQNEARRSQKEEHDRVLRGLQTEKANAIAQADRGSQAIAAGRDVNFYAGSQSPQQTPTKESSDEPTFDLTFKPSPDDFVHLLLTNKSTPAEFHIDVIDVAAREPQTTPYPVKWVGFAGEDRRIVREALIDLAEVCTPGRCMDGDTVIFINPYIEKEGYWESGYFRLFSFSQQGGWVARGVDLPTDGMPDGLRFFRERVSLTVRATRIHTGEEITRRVTIAFKAPTLDSRTREWIIPSPAIRVEVKATIPASYSEGGQ